AAKTQPTMTPMRIPSLEIIPRPAIVHNTIASKVTAATIGWVWKLDAAVGAKFKPIKATMAPVTAGGMTASTTLRPAKIGRAACRETVEISQAARREENR